MKQKRIHTRNGRKRQLYTRITAVAALLILGIAGIWGIRNQSMPVQGQALVPPQIWSRDEGIAHLQELAQTDTDYETVCQQVDQYSDSLISALCNNGEMLEFVKNYPTKEKIVYGTLAEEECSQEEIPLLLQWDERWGYAPYGDDNIALSGCGPVSLSMVLVGLTGSMDASPDAVAEFATEQGYYVAKTGTSWNLMTKGAEHFGVRGQDITPDKDSVFSLLKSDIPIICSMYPGDFTAKGHFIVLTGIEHGRIRVNDPMSEARSEKLWDWETFEPQIHHAWAFFPNS